MGFIAKDNGGDGNFKKVPPGVYVARCYSLIDMGTQVSDGQYGSKEQHKIRIGFEIFGEDDAGQPLTIDMDGKEMPLTISKTYTLSLHEKSGLRKDLAAWRGHAGCVEALAEADGEADGVEPEDSEQLLFQHLATTRRRPHLATL